MILSKVVLKHIKKTSRANIVRDYTVLEVLIYIFELLTPHRVGLQTTHFHCIPVIYLNKALRSVSQHP